MKKLCLLVFFSVSTTLSFGSLSVSIEYDIRHDETIFNENGEVLYEGLDSYFIARVLVENNADIHSIGYIGLRPNSGPSVLEYGDQTITIYDLTGVLLYRTYHLDFYLESYQPIFRGASTAEYLGISDMFSAINNSQSPQEYLWHVIPDGSVPLELVFVPEPCTLLLLGVGGLLIRKR